MEENLREIVEVKLEGNEKYTIDLSDRKVVIFCGDTYDNTNLIPQFIFSTKVGFVYEDRAREKLKYVHSDNCPIGDNSIDLIHSFPLYDAKYPDPKEVSKLGIMYYDFYRDIEYGKSPYEQIEFLENLVGKWDDWKNDSRKILISTHSPYILNYMNVIMARDQEFAKNISAYYVDSEYGVHCLDSTCNLTNRRILNTIDLSDPMEYIFEKYDEIE